MSWPFCFLDSSTTPVDFAQNDACFTILNIATFFFLSLDITTYKIVK